VKANSIYLIILLAAVAVTVLVMTQTRKHRVPDEHITLRRQDKIPYGTYVAHEMLTDMFPFARVINSREEPGYWDSLDMNEGGQAFISISKYFNASEWEMKKLLSFAENGNDVFISTAALSFAAEEILYSASENNISNSHYNNEDRSINDSLDLKLLKPRQLRYSYPGKNFSTSFRELNLHTADIIGMNTIAPNFIHLRAGKGNFYVQLAPLAFSNYFILHRNNIRYYETAFSVIPASTRRILWDEYYLYKPSAEQQPKSKNGWLAILMKYPGMRAGLLTAIFLLLVYVAMEMRRKQRPIPVITKPRNDSLDFVRTIGRLYYEKGDHRNLARKMTAYFLEYVRNNYKLLTSALDESFIRNLYTKSGYPEPEIKKIITNIQYIEDAPRIGSADLVNLYRQLESFYEKA
jgi:hypothetical protein